MREVHVVLATILGAAAMALHPGLAAVVIGFVVSAFLLN